MSDAAELRLATPGAELSRGYYRDCGRPLLYERFGYVLIAVLLAEIIYSVLEFAVVAFFLGK